LFALPGLLAERLLRHTCPGMDGGRGTGSPGPGRPLLRRRPCPSLPRRTDGAAPAVCDKRWNHPPGCRVSSGRSISTARAGRINLLCDMEFLASRRCGWWTSAAICATPTRALTLSGGSLRCLASKPPRPNERECTCWRKRRMNSSAGSVRISMAPSKPLELKGDLALFIFEHAVGAQGRAINISGQVSQNRFTRTPGRGTRPTASRFG